jgi:protein O-GlcNAc transferase
MILKRNGSGEPELFGEAKSAHRAGNIALAEARYLQVLQLEPEHFEAQHWLGVLRAQQGRNDEALVLIASALKADSASAVAHLNYGNILHALGRDEEALASYDKSLAISPESALALSNRGNVLMALKRFEEALDSQDRALAIKPDDIATLNNRATVLVALRRPEHALIDVDRVLAAQPRLAEAFNNRGNALKELKRFDEALSNYARAIELRPSYAKAFSNRGLLLFELGRLEEALANFDKALAISPNYADALNSRGNTLLFLERFEEATRDYEQALAIQPDHPWVPNGLADAVCKSCDWPRAGKIGHDLELHIIDAKSVINPFTLLAYRGEPQLQLECAQAFLQNRIPLLPEPLAHPASGRFDRIRLAYLSADFRLHPVASLIAELLESHDRTRFEILGFSFGKDDGSAMRTRLISALDQFHDVRSSSDREAAELIRDLDVDIAVDITGYTHDARPGILSYRPAPIQVSYLGFPATTGSPCVDYVIADKTVLPFDKQPFYTEKIVHLPDCYMATDSTRQIAESTSRREAGLPEHGFVFCCFNSSYKITAPIFKIWMRLLQATEGSVIWLAEANLAATKNLQSAAKANGIDAGRLVFAPRVPQPEHHLARYRLADLFLDTLPFNAHTTAADALWAGLPLLTCRGTSFCGRVAASLLFAVGLPELVTTTLEDYETTARILASDPSLLREYRSRLERNRLSFPLFDSARFRRNIEAAYIRMWERHLHGQEPHGFAV